MYRHFLYLLLQKELVINWCDLCLPANEQSCAEAHRIKLQVRVLLSSSYLLAFCISFFGFDHSPPGVLRFRGFMI